MGLAVRQGYVLTKLGSDLGTAVSFAFVFNRSFAQMFKMSSLGILRSAMAYFTHVGESHTDTAVERCGSYDFGSSHAATGKHRAGSKGAAICQQSIVSRTFSR